MSVLQKLLSLLILNSTPQELPYSLRLTMQLAVFYVLSGIVVLETTLSPDNLYAGILLGLIVQYVFAYAVLAALDKRARFLQTFCALIGAGILFNLLSWPVFTVFSDETAQDALKSTMSLLRFTAAAPTPVVATTNGPIEKPSALASISADTFNPSLGIFDMISSLSSEVRKEPVYEL